MQQGLGDKLLGIRPHPHFGDKLLEIRVHPRFEDTLLESELNKAWGKNCLKLDDCIYISGESYLGLEGEGICSTVGHSVWYDLVRQNLVVSAGCGECGSTECGTRNTGLSVLAL